MVRSCKSPTAAHHNSLRPNCSCRGEFAWLVITPNDVEVTLVLGPANCTVLKALSASNRNCARRFWRISKVLKNDRSKLVREGTRSTGEKIGSLPNVNAAG